MIKKILVTTVLTFALSTTTAWAQGCDSGNCGGCDGGVSAGCDGGGYGGSIGSGGCDGGGCSSGGCDGGGCASGACGGGGCAVGQNFFAGGNCGSCKYIRAFGGWNILDDLDTAVTGTVAGSIEFDDGWAAGTAFGKRCGNRRTELELTHRHNSFDQLIGNNVSADGNISTSSAMFNVLFDMNMIRINDANFYAGGGLGLSYADLHVTSPVDASAYDTGFAWQGIAGLEKQLRNGTKAFAEYRYFSSEFDFGSGDLDYNAHNIFFGFELSR